MAHQSQKPESKLAGEIMHRMAWEKDFVYDFSNRFVEYLQKALEYISIGKTGCQMYTYMNMVHITRPFKVAEVGLLLKILSGSTPKELGITLKEYMDFLREDAGNVQRVLEVDEKALEDYAINEARVKASIYTGVPDSKKIIIQGV